MPLSDRKDTRIRSVFILLRTSASSSSTVLSRGNCCSPKVDPAKLVRQTLTKTDSMDTLAVSPTTSETSLHSLQKSVLQVWQWRKFGWSDRLNIWLQLSQIQLLLYLEPRSAQFICTSGWPKLLQLSAFAVNLACCNPSSLSIHLEKRSTTAKEPNRKQQHSKKLVGFWHLCWCMLQDG